MPNSGGGAAGPLLTVRDLSVRFKLDRETVAAVKDVSFDLQAGETLGFVGESGSGKSVTARSIMRLLPATAELDARSRIALGGQEIQRLSGNPLRRIRGGRIAMVFQEPMTSLNPIYRVGDQVAETLMLHQGLDRARARSRVVSLFEEVWLDHAAMRAAQYPHEMSGGQRQRVMIAMAIANNPELLIADEPTTALDVTVQAEILKLLKNLQRSHGMAMLFITHDIGVVRSVSDRVAVMRKGEIVETGPTDEVLSRPQHPYTRRLLASEPSGRPDPVPENGGDLLAVTDLRVEYVLRSGGIFRRKTQALKAVDEVSVSVRRGETLGVVGESGSGKSTLGRAVLRLVHLDGGRIEFHGQRIEGFTRAQMRPLRPRMQVVFQDPFSSLNPRLSVKQIIEEGLVVNGMGGNAAERDALVCEALTDVSLDPNSRNRFPHEFSGGQRQRIAIARALVLRPEFMLLDEPTSALDLSVQAQVIDLLRALQRKYELTYIFISHDLRVVRALCHRIVVMRHGRVVEQGSCDEVLQSPQTDYTRALISAAFEVAA